MYESFPFLLHTNWNHDNWSQSAVVSAREINYMRIQRGGAPVWAAANALLADSDDRARRTLRHVTSAIRKACMHSVSLGDNDISDMRMRLITLVHMHHSTLPILLGMDTLAEVDMVGLYLAVLAKVWSEPESTSEGALAAPSSFEILLQKAELKPGLDKTEAALFLTMSRSRDDNADTVDLVQEARTVQRIDNVMPRVLDSAAITAATRKRTQTKRFGDEAASSTAKHRKRLKVTAPETLPMLTVRHKRLHGAHTNCGTWDKGDRIQCLYNTYDGGWYPGTILKVNKTGTYDIRLVSR